MQVSPITPDGFQVIDSSCPDSDRLHVYSGNLVKTINLFNIPTFSMPLEFSLYHNAQDIGSAGDVGIGWRHSAQAQLSRASSVATTIVFTDETGRRREFELVSSTWVLKDNSLFADLVLSDLGSGLWRISYEPHGQILEFAEQGGSPILSRLTRVLDRNGNELQLHYNLSGQLTDIEEPVSGRMITLGWTGGYVSDVTDPGGNAYSLSYTDDLLTTLEMPDGCLLEHTYDVANRVESRTDRDGHSTLYHYDASSRLIEVEGPEENEVRPSVTWDYSEEPVEEVLAHVGDLLELAQVFFTTARGKVWEFRFLPSSKLWREIGPTGHHRRFYYDDRQNMLYSSEGYGLSNVQDAPPTYWGPRDNFNNRFRFYSYTLTGQILQSIDANGLATAYTYQDQLLTMVYPGQAHYGLGGDWRAHFCQDGYLFCEHAPGGGDWAQLPDYVSAVTPGTDLQPVSTNPFWYMRLSHQVLDGVEPNEGDRYSSLRRIGHWTADGGDTFDFQIELNEAKAFNLSLYTSSLDQITGGVFYEGLPPQYNSAVLLDYPEVYGREVDLTVTDKRGVQTYKVTQNAGGVWVTFPVVGDEENPILVEVHARQSNHVPVISALAFDPFEDRRVFMEYDEDRNLTRVTQPTSDSAREIYTEYSYNADGTVSQVVQALKVDGALTDSRTTTLGYLDDDKNLTRVEDPLNQDDFPTLMLYDENSNLIQVTDPDGKVMVFEYDYRRRLIRIEDGEGNVTAMVYNGRGLLTSITDPNNNETVLTYTPARRLATLTNALGEVTSYSYLADGLLESITDPGGNTVSFAYNDRDQLVAVTYPETEVVLPNLERDSLTPELRLAYDVWNRLAAVTPPNGNLADVNAMNLVGALDILSNADATEETGMSNEVPTAWEQGFAGADFMFKVARSTDQTHDSPYSLPLTGVSSGTLREWIQRRLPSGVGARYLMEGWARLDNSGTFWLRAVTRNFEGDMEEQNSSVAISANTWTQFQARADMPEDAQVTRTMPVFHHFRAGLQRSASFPPASGWLADLHVHSLSQIIHYDGENQDGSTGPDGARVTMVRDRIGRVRKIIDPTGRTVEFEFDALDRILTVRDSQGLSLAYDYDFLGNLVSFTDSEGRETTFLYDELNRLLQIIQPGGEQIETFAYSPAGDLVSYTNLRGQERQFSYDNAHRLTRIDYLGETTESVLLTYDDAGNLLTLTERNGDQLVMTHDALNRLVTTVRTPALGSEQPAWSLTNDYDSRGNRKALVRGSSQNQAPRYGDPVTAYGNSDFTYGEVIFEADYNNRSQMTALRDLQGNRTEFGFDVDGRLVEVEHPNGLKTNHAYDLVGKLLSTGVTAGENDLWNLSYGYSLSADRLAQHSQWAEGGNTYRYRLDDSGRLVSEAINRFVVDDRDSLACGELKFVGRGSDNKLRLVSRDDDFASNVLDLQRWRLDISDPIVTNVRVRQDDGLHCATSVGKSRRTMRTLPLGWARTGSHSYYDDYTAGLRSQPVDNVGFMTNGGIALRHRVPLEGEFDIEVAVSEYVLFDSSSKFGMGVTRDRFSTTPGGGQYPNAGGLAVNSHGCDFLIDGGSGFNVKFNNLSIATTPKKLRLKRFLDGSDWKIQAYYWDGDSWETHASWVAAIDPEPMYAYLLFYGDLVLTRFADFAESQGTQYPLSSVSMTESVNQAAWPFFESPTYDAGRSVDWSQISWTETLPSNTDVRLQIATSSSPNGPWNYAGPSGADSYYSTPAGTALSGVTGRYCKWRAFLFSTDGLDTPELWNVHLSHSGTSGSRQTLWTYDEAGNITQIDVITDSGVDTEVRSHNDLNQLTERTVGGVTWTYAYDSNGCLVMKTNGSEVGDEQWEFSWDADDRLIQVKKDVWTVAGTPVARFGITDYGESAYGFGTGTLTNAFTVDYQYDSAGRMMLRDDGTNVTRFTWDAWYLLRETTGEVPTDYLVPGMRIWSFVRNGDLYTAHCDGSGSLRLVTNSGGEVVARFEYGAFGSLLEDSFDEVPGGTPFRWIGALGVRTDSDTGLYYMRHRWYDPSLGRFLSRDPIGFAGSLNAYGYVNQNPTNRVDPSGLHEILVPDPNNPQRMVPVPHMHLDEDLKKDPAKFDGAYNGADGLMHQSLSGSGLRYVPPGSPLQKGTYSDIQYPPGQGSTSTCYYYAAARTGLIDPFEDKGARIGSKGFHLPWEGLQLLVNSGISQGKLVISDTPEPGSLIIWTKGNVVENGRLNGSGETAWHAGVSVSGGYTDSKMSAGPIFIAPPTGFLGTPIYVNRRR